MKKQGITTVNITRKKTRLIDKDGNVIEETDTGGDFNNDLKERQKRRAERLGLPFRG